MENVAVLPVPDWACAMTSRPCVMGKIARCWIAEGFSKSKTYEQRKRRESEAVRTVRVDSPKKIFFQAEVVERRDNGDSFRRFKYKFLCV